jgi:hypothetical protein
MSIFHIAIEEPTEIIPRLGKQQLHWKKGRSAFELSSLWMKAGGIPPSVRSVLDQAPEWHGAKLLKGIFECETDLPGKGRPSQTDLLGMVALRRGGIGILGVEGKVDEPFGSVVDRWLVDAGKTEGGDANAVTRSEANKRARLTALCGILHTDPDLVGGLHYQLIHRSCASLLEAKRFHCGHAMMLVHSFAIPEAPSLNPACFDDFSRFAEGIGMPVSKPGSVSKIKVIDEISFRLGWVSDAPSS